MGMLSVWTIIHITSKSTGDHGNWNKDARQTEEKMDINIVLGIIIIIIIIICGSSSVGVNLTPVRMFVS